MKPFKTFAVATLVAAALAAPAVAAPWTDPSGAFTISNPANWKIERMSEASSQVIQYFGGTGSHECWFNHIPRPDSADKSVAAVKKAFGAPIGDAMWAQAFGALSKTEPPTVVEAKVEDNAGWPVQTATLSTKEGTVLAAIHGRPGFEVRSYCQSFDKKDRSAEFSAILKGLSSPKDAEWATAEANATAEAAKQAAAQQEAAAAAEAANAKGKKKKKGE
jgi:hypothetical protein